MLRLSTCFIEKNDDDDNDEHNSRTRTEPTSTIGLSLTPVRKFGTVCRSLSGLRTLQRVLSASSRPF